jgi:hypothetical protein
MQNGQIPEHKVIITGTGRSGTTFLVHLLTELGLDTGITRKNWEKKYFEHCNAGLEHDLLDPQTPYIVKNPALCETLPAALATGRFVIDHAYVAIRELGAVAASRSDVGGSNGNRPGGLVGTSEAAAQRSVLAESFHGLIHTLAENDIPLTVILFPRMVSDAAYTYGKLAFLLKGTSRASFEAAFGRIARPSLVHTFGPAAAPVERAPLPKPRPRGLSRYFPFLRQDGVGDPGNL